MTLYLIDVDAATLILERIKGLTTLAENQIDSMFDSDRVESVPLNAAIFCIKEHVEAMTALLNSGVDPTREGEPT